MTKDKKRRSTWLRITLAVGGGSLFMLIVMGALGYYFWVHQLVPSVEGAQVSLREGIAFGASTDDVACKREALARYAEDRSFVNAQRASAFLSGCLSNARKTTTFCEDVPRLEDILGTTRWSVQQCFKIEDVLDRHCTQLFSVIQAYCEMRRQPNVDDDTEQSDSPPPS